LALVVVFGWQAWQKHQVSEAQGASVLYQQLLESSLVADGQADVGKVAELAGKLKTDYAGSHYAQYASLLLAKVAVEAGKLDDARAQLQAVLDKPADATLGELARQRLARVMAAQDKTDDALKLLAGDAEQAFVAAREELKGDLLVKLQRSDEALQAYEKAKAALTAEAAVGGLQIKIDDLAKGDA
jgi:predicted negative regulator of RcsB-dependent stress response